jgi:hypothetical protein
MLRAMARFSPPKVSHYARSIPAYWGSIESAGATMQHLRELDSPVDFKIVRGLFSEEELEEVWAERIEFVNASNPRSMVDVMFAVNLCGLQGSVAKQNMLSLSTGHQMHFPYCDRRFTAFAKDIDPTQKFRHWGLTAKHIEKMAAQRRVPKFITTRPKQSGELPVKRWLQEGEFEQFLREHRQVDVGIDLERLRHEAFVPGRYNYFLFWGYVNLVAWKENFLDRFGPVSME